MEPAQRPSRRAAYDRRVPGAEQERWDGEVAAAGAARFTSRLERWLAEARVDAATEARSREHWLQAMAAQEASIGGLLLDLAERQVTLVLTVGGRRHRGVVRALGADFVALDQADRSLLVRVAAVSLVRTVTDTGPPLGDRVLTTQRQLAHVLEELAAERARVAIVTADGTTVAGSLRSVGRDVLVLRTDGDPPGAAYVPLPGIVEVVLAQ
jgi:hypothetical protein